LKAYIKRVVYYIKCSASKNFEKSDRQKKRNSKK
jgi:hypothetical protein